MSATKLNSTTTLSNADALRLYADEVFALNARAINALPQMTAYLIMCVHENRCNTETEVPTLKTISEYKGAAQTAEYDRFALALTGYSKEANLREDNKTYAAAYVEDLVSDYNAKRSLIARNLKLAVDLHEGQCSPANFNKDAGQFMLPPAMYLAPHVVPAPGSSLFTDAPGSTTLRDKPLPIDGKSILLIAGDTLIKANRSLAHVSQIAAIRRCMNENKPLPVNKISEALKAAGKAKLVTDKVAAPEKEPEKADDAKPAGDAKPADKPADKPTGATSNDPTGNVGVDGKPLSVTGPSTTDLKPGYKQLTLTMRDAVNVYKASLIRFANKIEDLTTYDLTPDGFAALNNAISTLALIRDAIITSTEAYDKDRAAQVAKAHEAAKQESEQKAKRQAAPPIDNVALVAKVKANKSKAKAAAAGK